jgi:adenosylmethionine-8-amino-7-oxononanoate aminotransferase
MSSPRIESFFHLPDKRRLAYAEYGDANGTPVFLFHGLPGPRLSWGLPPDNPFPARLRIVAPDRPGYGRSDAKPCLLDETSCRAPRKWRMIRDMRNTSNVFHRSPDHDYPVAVRGDGAYLYDSSGKQYLDGSGGAAVSCLGHGNPEVVAAIKAQVEQLAYAHTAFFTNEPQEHLAARLVERFPAAGARVYFLSGGSEANETAIKLARQYWLSQGKPDKHIVISRNQSYHGNTVGALSVSGNPGRREIFAPILHDWPRIDPCYAFRHQNDGESEQDYGVRTAQSLERAIDEQGADNIAGFIAETVVGATLGAVPPVEGYFRQIREICDRHDILLILDEVMCGSGRSGTYFAFEQDGVVPDIVTTAKGLAGGYQAIGAALTQGFVHDSIVAKFGCFAHGHTYIGHATACAAAIAVSNVIDEQDLLGNVQKIGELLSNELRSSLAENPFVGDIRGRGLLIGIELVADRVSNAPADPALASAIKNAAMDEGLIIYPGGGTADGVSGAHVMLAPPFIFTKDHVDELVTKLGKVLVKTGLH